MQPRMTMQRLPIPPVEQTLSRFLDGVSPLLSKDEVDQTQAAIDLFNRDSGPILQQRLKAYADEQAQENISWLTKVKLGAYLNDRRPLALSNNPGLQLAYPSNDTGLQRAATFIYRIARTHIDYMTGRIEQPVDGRGSPISMYNWRVLSGAMRLPLVDQDRYHYAPSNPEKRYISVMWQSHHIALQITDEAGRLFSITDITQSLKDIIETTYDTPKFNFMALSALGSDKTGAYLNTLCELPHNKKTYQTLCDSLFCVSLYNSGEDEFDQLRKHTFLPGYAWQYKPFTYQLDLESNFTALHFEHSEVDGGTLRLIYNHAFALDERVALEKSDRKPQMMLLDWQTDDGTAANIIKDIDHICQQAKQVQLRHCRVDYSAIDTKVSHDAIIQFSLIYAQLKLFKKVRLTYEAVDTSHYEAGRTEAMRPVSAEAIALCHSLLDNTATKDKLTAAFAVHKQRVIACKTGQAYDRHLTGLQMMIREEDDKHSIKALFNSPGYKKLTAGDFLSTTSVGARAPIKRVIFMPVIEGGIGVYYSYNDDEYEFVLMGDGLSSQYLDEMIAACAEGAEKIIALFTAD